MPLSNGTVTASAGTGTFETVKPGTYRLNLVDIEETTSANFRNPEQTDDKWVWKFEIDAQAHPKTTLDDGRAYPIQKWTGAFFGPRSKAREIASALLGREIALGETVDLNGLIGRAALGVIKYQVDFNTKQVVKNEDGTPKRNAIETFLPIDDDEDDESPAQRAVGAAAVKEAF